MKSRKVLTILLSLAIMVTFMPTFAFAAPPESDEHDWTLDTTKSTAATCKSYGFNYWKCEGDIVETAKGFEQLDCDASWYEFEEVTDDHDYQPVYLTKDKYLEAKLEKENARSMAEKNRPLSDAETKAIVDELADACTVYTVECKVCGDIYVDLDNVEDSEYFLNHEPVKDTPDCAKTFECKYCHQTIERENPAAHAEWDVVETTENVCGGYIVETRKCKACGEEWKVNTNPTAMIQTNHTGLGDEVTPTDAEIEAQKYVEYKGKYYAYNEVVTAPTCTSAGEGTLICADCLRGNFHQGLVNAVIPATGHDYTTVTLPANHYHGDITVQYCKKCGATGTVTTKNNKIDHAYTVEVVEEPNCICDGITLIKCDCGLVINLADLDEEEFDALFETVGTGKDAKLYFVGLFGELKEAGTPTAPYEKCIVVADWRSEGQHIYSDYVKAADATCTVPELQARVCENCGHIDVHHTREIGKALGHDTKTFTVAATCGTYGYTYDTCSRCKESVQPEGVTTGDWVQIEPNLWIYEYNVVDPVVSEGTPCKFAWGDVDDETEAEICTVCGAVKAGTETPKTDDAKKAKQVEKAKPIIDAAANILAESDVYTAASVAAIEEAKANLNSAIAAGTSTDVKNMAAALQAAVDGAKLKDANTMTASGKTVKASKNKTKTFKKSKAFSVKKAKGKVTFAKKSGNGKIVVSKKGKVTVKSGLKKGTYKVKVAVTAAGNGNYLPKTKVVTLKVKVK